MEGVQRAGADGESDVGRACKSHGSGETAWSSRVDSLEQKGFLADVESGCFRVEVLELCPEPCEGPPLLLEHLALGDSTDVSGAATLCRDHLVTASSLTCR